MSDRVTRQDKKQQEEEKKGAKPSTVPKKVVKKVAPLQIVAKPDQNANVQQQQLHGIIPKKRQHNKITAQAGLNNVVSSSGQSSSGISTSKLEQFSFSSSDPNQIRSKYNDINPDDIVYKMYPKAEKPQTDQFKRDWKFKRMNGTLTSWVDGKGNSRLLKICQRHLKEQALYKPEDKSSAGGAKKKSNTPNGNNNTGRPSTVVEAVDGSEKLLFAMVEGYTQDGALRKIYKHYLQQINKDVPLTDKISFVTKVINQDVVKNYLRLIDHDERRIDEKLSTLYGICSVSQLLYGGVQTIIKNQTLNSKDMDDIRRFMHDKYKNLDVTSDELADFSHKELHKLNHFFSKYAEQMQDNTETTIGWHPMALYHGCLLGQIRYFIEYAHKDVISETVSNQIRGLNIPTDPKANNLGQFSKILWALHKAFPNICLRALKNVIKGYQDLSSLEMLTLLNSSSESVQESVSTLIYRVLKQEQNYAEKYDQLTDLVEHHSQILKAFTEKYRVDLRNWDRLELDQLKAFCANNKGASEAKVLMMLAAKDVKPEDILKSTYVHSKARDVLTKEEILALDNKVKEEEKANDFVAQYLPQVEEVCKHFDAQNHILKPRSYQKYAAAFIIHKLLTHQRFVWKLDSGQGKTLISILVMMTLAKFHQDFAKTFLVVLPNNFLKDQFAKTVMDHGITTKIRFYAGNDWHKLVDQYEMTFIDEGDFFAKNQTVNYDEANKLSGMNKLIAKKFLMCSATFPKIENEILRDAMQLDLEQQMYAFKSTFTLLRGFQVKPTLRPEYKSDPKQLDAFLKQQCDEARTKSTLIFMEKNDPKLVALIKNYCTANKINCVAGLASEQEMAQLVHAMTGQDCGVFIIVIEYGRGVDFKLLNDARVIILLNGDLKMTLSEAYQIAGRGTRSLATPSATVVLCVESQINNVMSILETNDQENVADAVVMIEQLYKNYEALLANNTAKAKLVREATKDMKWRNGLNAVANATARKWLEGTDNNN